MDTERYEILKLRRLPARLNPEETAHLLGFRPHDIPVLVAHGLLTVLGNPPPNGARYFAISEIERVRLDTKWLDKASGLLVKHWKRKNSQRTEPPRSKVTIAGSASPPA